MTEKQGKKGFKGETLGLAVKGPTCGKDENPEEPWSVREGGEGPEKGFDPENLHFIAQEL